MNKTTLLRFSAVAAIIGGALRIGDAFLANSGTQLQQFAYFATDVMLIFGLCGIYFSRSNRLGFAGLFGFFLAITGIMMVRTFSLIVVNAEMGAPQFIAGYSYLVGAAITLLGVDLISIIMLIRGAFPKVVPILWITSLVFGVTGMFGAAIHWAVPLAGAAFGAGFIAAGVHLSLDASSGAD
jgi:hypothetical protein